MALSGLGGDELFAGYPVFKRTELLYQSWLWKFAITTTSSVVRQVDYSIKEDTAKH